MKEPILFIPGFMTDERLFAAQVRAVASAHPVMTAPIAECERIESFASELLSVAPPKFALVGFGLGGTVALELLRRQPNRVTRIALIATAFQAETPQVAADREPQLIAAATGRFDEVLRQTVSEAGYGPGAGRVAVQSTVTRMGQELGKEVFRRHSRALQRRRDQQTTLKMIHQPTLVMGGRHDRLLPIKRLEVMAELIPSARLSVLEEAGHFPTLETPEAATDALADWLGAPAPR
ncbi:alpha/beta fold hydrolase [Pelagovum pacificum]|uniref:Alpha/beta hydrolase n=1 Tax=Pelagovum pacificum TaxID=2588711 RepID=A0A5C5G804_9RHOB|nr:alpha/beta hydrolase [Pelagovum pacificum]QQA41613.1 alpha/beta hydrolase [Pelagovum pacificum]TNY30893.1 alpha/beta hydrolase [Pelagovum pacificum]